MVACFQPFTPLWMQHPAFRSSLLRNQLHYLQSGMNGLLDRSNEDDGPEPGVAASHPTVNIWEDADFVHLEAELPGLEPADVEIYITGGNQLTIKGERKQKVEEKGSWHRLERGFGSFARVLTLPIEVDRDKVEARCENGILLLKLAKQESSKPRRITVTG